MTKSILTVLTVLFAFSAPAFASSVIYQEEPAAEAPAQPSGEGEQQGGGGGE